MSRGSEWVDSRGGGSLQPLVCGAQGLCPYGDTVRMQVWEWVGRNAPTLISGGLAGEGELDTLGTVV